VCSGWEVLLDFATDEIDAALELIDAIHAILDANPIWNPPGGFQGCENGIVVIQALTDFPMGEAARVPDGIIFLISQILDGAVEQRPVGCVHRDDAVFYDIKDIKRIFPGEEGIGWIVIDHKARVVDTRDQGRDALG
jgi:hypothetical protein